MSMALKLGGSLAVCIALGAAGLYALANPKRSGKAEPSGPGLSHQGPAKASRAPGALGTDYPLFSTVGFETAGFGTANQFTGTIADRGSIEQVREAIGTRAKRGIEACMGELRAIPRDDPGQLIRAIRAEGTLSYLLMYEGRFVEAAMWTERAIADARRAGLPEGLRANLGALLGVIHLRRGETENCLDCLGPSACIFPIAAEAVHLKPSGSRAAAQHFTEYLRLRPEDQGVRWLLNVASMTLGEYPDKVPSEFLMPIDAFRSKQSIVRFENIAAAVGLNARGPNMAGGSVFDDFTGDGLPDIFTTSMDVDLGASLFVSRGDGTFEDRSESAGLRSQPYAVNCVPADYDNDGNLDVILLRGGWENPARLSLLRNRGGGIFEDVTLSAGLGEPIASHSASWGDFDNDGKLDVFVCGEYAVAAGQGITGDKVLSVGDKRNRCRLYRNQGNGTFLNVAESAGVCNDRYAKASACGDFDGDGLVDLYVSNYGQENRLYRNRGDWTFEDVAPRLGVKEPIVSFSCGFLDFDNDGRLDIFVTDYAGGLGDWVASMMGQPARLVCHPRLFKNLGASGFKDVSSESGLGKVALAMGLGVGDIDNDGFLDLYLGTGRPDYSSLMPNILFRNEGGQRFEDITESSGTGHLQKGHGASFADFDGDGDLDLFVEVGGAVPGDRANNLLFRNPGHGRHWLKVKLVGTRTNRAAIGATIRVDLKNADGTTRSVHRTIGGTSSYGNSSLVQQVGLGESTSVSALTVTWPVSRSTQTFRDLRADTLVEITEGESTPRIGTEAR